MIIKKISYLTVTTMDKINYNDLITSKMIVIK